MPLPRRASTAVLGLLDLPNEVLLKIFGFIEDDIDFVSLFRTSRRLCDLAFLASYSQTQDGERTRTTLAAFHLPALLASEFVRNKIFGDKSCWPFESVPCFSYSGVVFEAEPLARCRFAVRRLPWEDSPGGGGGSLGVEVRLDPWALGHWSFLQRIGQKVNFLLSLPDLRRFRPPLVVVFSQNILNEYAVGLFKIFFAHILVRNKNVLRPNGSLGGFPQLDAAGKPPEMKDATFYDFTREVDVRALEVDLRWLFHAQAKAKPVAGRSIGILRTGEDVVSPCRITQWHFNLTNAHQH